MDVDWWRDPKGEDVAILRVALPLPTGVRPLPLGSTTNVRAGSICATYGFPAAKLVEGLPGKVEITGASTEHGFSVLAVRSNEVSHGFSGAPAWDPELGTVMGMVKSLIPADFDPAGRQSEVTFVIPAETLLDVCPPLRVAPRCPYRGLDVFEEEHASEYFGREAATQTLVAKLASESFVALVGVSGSGKSSLTRAGIRRALDEQRESWLATMPRYRVLPGRRPVLDLALGLGADTMAQVFRDLGVSVDLLTTEQGRSEVAGALESQPPLEIARTVTDQLQATGALVIVDQFERLFTECDDETRRAHFISVLLDLAEHDLRVLIAVRADFYGQALEYARLAHAIEQAQVTLLSMTEDELIRTIREPATRAHVALQPGLGERMRDDVIGRAGGLPLLEFALTEMWSRDAPARVLTEATYQSIGGLQGALAEYAERVWRQFRSDHERASVQRIFVTLISGRSTATDGGPSAFLASRRAWLQVELETSDATVVETLVATRLLTASRDTLSGQPTVELAHEALIHAWPRLESWVTRHAAYIRWYDRDFVPYLRRWVANTKKADLLLPPTLLDEAQRWLQGEPEMFSASAAEYIDASRRAAENELRIAKMRARRARLAAGIIAVLAISAAVLALFARDQRNTARREAADARRQAASATSLALTGYANLRLANRPDVSALLDLAAYRLNPGDAYDSMFAARETADLSGVTHVLRGYHNSDVLTGVAFDASRHVLVIGDSGTVRLWDTRDQGWLGVRFPPSAAADALALSPGGHAVAVVNEGEVTLWRLGAQWVRGATIRPGPVFDNHVDLSPDGHTLAVSKGNGFTGFTLWDAAADRKISPLIRTDAYPVFSANGREVAYESDRGRKLRLWSVPRRRAVGRPLVVPGDELSGGAKFLAWAFSPDGRKVAALTYDGVGTHVGLWDVASQRIINNMTAPQTAVALAFTPDGRTLAFQSGDGIALWDPYTRQRQVLPIGDRASVGYLAFSPDGQTLALDDGATVRMVAVGGSRVGVQVIGPAPGFGDEVAFSPTGSVLASGGGENSDLGVHLWDLRTGRAAGRPFANAGSTIFSFAFSPDGRVLAVGGDSNAIRLWDVRNHRQLGVLKMSLPGAPVVSIAFSAHGHMLAAANASGIELWDTRTYRRSGPLIGVTGLVHALAFDPTGRILASGGDGPAVYLWDTRTHKRTGSPLTTPAEILSVAFSPDGRILAAGGVFGTLRLWDVRSHHPIGASLRAPAGPVHVAFIPSGRILAFTSADNRVRLWDVRTLRPAGSPLVSHGAYSVAISPDGRTLASGSEFESVTLWGDLFWGSVTELGSQVCRYTGGGLTRQEWASYTAPGIPFQRTCPA